MGNEPFAITRYSIDTCSLLVEINTSVWTARKLDRGSTDELVTSKRAGSKDAARVNKHLLAGRKELDVIAQHVGNVRNRFVYPQTLPWSDKGLRLLPSIKFLEFNSRMVQEEDTFWKLVNHFIDVYPTLITAQAMALGDMFNREDFPSVDVMKQKFAFSVNYIPVPASGDFRIDVGNAAMQELQQRHEVFTKARVDNAMADVRGRLKEHLDRMSKQLTIDVVAGESKPRVFQDSLLDGAAELVSNVKFLNLVGDPDLEAARVRLAQAVEGVSTEELRKNTGIRSGVKAEVDSMLKSISW